MTAFLAPSPLMAAVPVVAETDLVGLNTEIVGDTPANIAIDPHLRRVYVVERGGRMLFIHDAVTLKRLHKTPLGANPAGIAIDRTTHAVYVANSGSGTITLYDPLRRRALERRVGGTPNRLAIDATRGRVIVTEGESRSVAVLDRNLSALGRFRTDSIPQDIVVHPISGRFVVLTKDRLELRGFSPDLTSTISAWSPTGPKPLRLALDPVLDRVFVLNSGDGTISTFDAQSLGIIGAPIPLALPAQGTPSVMPADLALDIDARRLYVANRAGTGSVSIVNARHRLGGAAALMGRPEVYLGAEQRTLALTVSDRSGQVFMVSGADRSLKRLVPLTRTSIIGTGELGFGAVAINPAAQSAYISWRQEGALLGTSLSPYSDFDKHPLGIGSCTQPRDPAGLRIDLGGAHGCRLYAACPCSGRLVALDCNDPKRPVVLSSIVSPGATGLTLDTTGTRLFVTYPDLQRLRSYRVTASGLGSVLGQASLSLSAISPPSGPRAIAFDAASSNLFIGHELDPAGIVTVLQSESLALRERMQLGGLAQDITGHSGEDHIYVANGLNSQGDSIVVLNGYGSEVARIPVYRPQILALGEPRHLYVGTQSGRLVILDPTQPEGKALLGEMQLLRGGFTGLAIDGQSRQLIATGGMPAEIIHMRTVDLF